MTVDYSKERVQFGRPIGSFQALKHRMAEVFARTESARSASLGGVVRAGGGGGRCRLPGPFGGVVRPGDRGARRVRVRAGCTGASRSPGSTTPTSCSSARTPWERWPAQHTGTGQPWHSEPTAPGLLGNDGRQRLLALQGGRDGRCRQAHHLVHRGGGKGLDLQDVAGHRQADQPARRPDSAFIADIARRSTTGWKRGCRTALLIQP
nr:acyl-CoA dehydrogenase family protein [Nocardioides convexus]